MEIITGGSEYKRQLSLWVSNRKFIKETLIVFGLRVGLIGVGGCTQKRRSLAGRRIKEDVLDPEKVFRF